MTGEPSDELAMAISANRADITVVGKLEFMVLFPDLRLVPGVAALREQIVRGYRAPRSGSVEFAVGKFFAFPAFAD